MTEVEKKEALVAWRHRRALGIAMLCERGVFQAAVPLMSSSPVLSTSEAMTAVTNAYMFRLRPNDKKFPAMVMCGDMLVEVLHGKG